LIAVAESVARDMIAGWAANTRRHPWLNITDHARVAALDTVVSVSVSLPFDFQITFNPTERLQSLCVVPYN